MSNDTQDVFEQTVQQAEQDAQADPRRYRMKLLAFALLGYLVIFALLVVLLGLVGGMAATALFSTAAFILLLKKKLIFVLLPTIWIIAKALWIRLEPPSGYTVTRERCPALWAEVDALRSSLDTPKVHEVILTPEMNAAVAQTPRLGLFGWQRNTVILGLELLLALSPEQARAVLAHEFGHLSGNHSRFSGWIYRVRESWARLMHAFEQQASFGGRLLARFFHWYAPRFSAYSFVLARSNEFEADAAARELTSAAAASEALVTTHVTGSYVNEHYWRDYFRKADTMPEPEHLPWSGLKQFLGKDTRPEAALNERLELALAVETSYADTHPALKDRLAALGVAPELPDATGQTAAEAWLGTTYASVIEDFDRQWYEYNAPQWRERFEYVRDSRQRLDTLNTQSATRPLDDRELWDQARMTEELESGDAAYPLFLAYQSRHPDDPDAAFVLGRILFGRDDPGVVDCMRKALSSPELAVDACQYAYHYLMDNDREQDAAFFRDEAQKRQEQQWEADAERSSLEPDDTLVPADISDELRIEIVTQLSESPLVGKAWLAQKPVKHYPEVPALAIAVTSKGLHFSEDGLADKLAEAFEFPDVTFFVVPKTGNFKPLAKRIIKAGEQIV